MYKYEIMTENKNLNLVAKIVAGYFSGFSIVKQLGYWEGKQEQSLNIVIFGKKNDEHAIRDIADRIKTVNNQDCVLWAKTECEMNLYQ